MIYLLQSSECHHVTFWPTPIINTFFFYLFVFIILLLLKIIILKKYATKAAKMDSLLGETKLLKLLAPKIFFFAKDVALLGFLAIHYEGCIAF